MSFGVFCLFLSCLFFFLECLLLRASWRERRGPAVAVWARGRTPLSRWQAGQSPILGNIPAPRQHEQGRLIGMATRNLILLSFFFVLFSSTLASSLTAVVLQQGRRNLVCLSPPTDQSGVRDQPPTKDPSPCPSPASLSPPSLPGTSLSRRALPFVSSLL